MISQIHPTAIVSADAQIGADVTIGPYAVVEADVVIGPGCKLAAGAIIHRYVRMGSNNHIHAHAVLGDLPQDLSFKGEETWVHVGDDNIIREGATLHRSTEADVPTRLGSGCYLMAYSHLGHGAQVGNGVILTNNVMLAGHTEVGERAVFGGNAGMHQFTRVGAYAMVAGFIPVRKDVLPFTMVGGEPVRHYRLNTVGLRRAGIKGDRYRCLEKAFRILKSGSDDLSELPDTPELRYLRDWLAAESKRGIYGFAALE